jgi:hypothetical protein
MAAYGIDKVRGGSYVTETLTDAQRSVLQQEISAATGASGSSVKPTYTPSDAVMARMAAIKEERRLKEEADAEAFERAVAEGKIEWEVEILLEIEEGRLPPRDILVLPLETWPEHDMKENVRLCNAQKDQERLGRAIGFKIPNVSWNQPGYKRYMALFSSGGGGMPYIHITPRVYSNIVSRSTVLQDRLDLAIALEYVQAGLPQEVMDAIQPEARSLIKERAKFRIDLLRRLYPTLQVRD